MLSNRITRKCWNIDAYHVIISNLDDLFLSIGRIRVIRNHIFHTDKNSSPVDNRFLWSGKNDEWYGVVISDCNYYPHYRWTWNILVHTLRNSLYWYLKVVIGCHTSPSDHTSNVFANVLFHIVISFYPVSVSTIWMNEKTFIGSTRPVSRLFRLIKYVSRYFLVQTFLYLYQDLIWIVWNVHGTPTNESIRAPRFKIFECDHSW